MTAAASSVEAVRAALPSALRHAYLNTGTYGPLSAPASDAVVRATREELEHGRTPILQDDAYLRHAAELRHALALLVGGERDQLSLTHHTTDGVNAVVWGLEWAAGDEVVTTNAEHEGVLVPLYQLRRRKGVAIRHVDVASGDPDAIVASLADALSSRTRLVVVSHVSYVTGVVLPLAEMTRLAHAAGALVAADGAQAVGAIPVDVRAAGVDAYAFPGQKWLCGPSGTGALYVADAARERIEPTVVGFYGTTPGTCDPEQPSFSFLPDGRRFEAATSFRPGHAGLHAAIEWLTGTVGLARALERTRALTAHALARLGAIPGARVVTPATACAGLASVAIAGLDARACAAELGRRGIVVRDVPHRGLLRLSCAFFNTEEEIDAAAAAIEEFHADRAERP